MGRGGAGGADEIGGRLCRREVRVPSQGMPGTRRALQQACEQIPRNPCDADDVRLVPLVLPIRVRCFKHEQKLFFMSFSGRFRRYALPPPGARRSDPSSSAVLRLSSYTEGQRTMPHSAYSSVPGEGGAPETEVQRIGHLSSHSTSVSCVVPKRDAAGTLSLLTPCVLGLPLHDRSPRIWAL